MFRNYSENPLYIDSKLRKSFKEGILSQYWYETYPMLFDEDDLYLALNQREYHFYEWFGAIQIYKDFNYLCLVEQYQFHAHKRKREIFENIVSKEVVDFIDSREFGRLQAPDLLAFSKEKSNWFFCEVKGGLDHLSKTQAEYFQKLMDISGKDILLMNSRLLE